MLPNHATHHNDVCTGNRHALDKMNWVCFSYEFSRSESLPVIFWGLVHIVSPECKSLFSDNVIAELVEHYMLGHLMFEEILIQP